METTACWILAKLNSISDSYGGSVEKLIGIRTKVPIESYVDRTEDDSMRDELLGSRPLGI